MIIITNRDASAVTEDYPILMKGRSTGMIVSMTAEKTGTILVAGDGCDGRDHQKVGYTSTKWKMSGFDKFDGAIANA